MNRPVQYFSDDYLKQCRKMSPTAIAKFLEDFRQLAASSRETSPQKLISIRIPENLLSAFRIQCELEGLRYQTKIKDLIRGWVSSE